MDELVFQLGGAAPIALPRDSLNVDVIRGLSSP
jgi:hypothetical protein